MLPDRKFPDTVPKTPRPSPEVSLLSVVALFPASFIVLVAFKSISVVSLGRRRPDRADVAGFLPFGVLAFGRSERRLLAPEDEAMAKKQKDIESSGLGGFGWQKSAGPLVGARLFQSEGAGLGWLALWLTPEWFSSEHFHG